jgi:hypothetical protein
MKSNDNELDAVAGCTASALLVLLLVSPLFLAQPSLARPFDPPCSSAPGYATVTWRAAPGMTSEAADKAPQGPKQVVSGEGSRCFTTSDGLTGCCAEGQVFCEGTCCDGFCTADGE